MELTDLYTYNPVSGVFRYKINRARMKVGSVAGASNGRYWQINHEVKKVLAHRAAWYFHCGQWPDGQIDHIDGDKLNNSIDNLQILSGRDNVNKAVQKIKKSGLPLGVTVQYGRFRATAFVDGNYVYLGYYDTPEQAHQAYLEAINAR